MILGRAESERRVLTSKESERKENEKHVKKRERERRYRKRIFYFEPRACVHAYMH